MLWKCLHNKIQTWSWIPNGKRPTAFIHHYLAEAIKSQHVWKDTPPKFQTHRGSQHRKGVALSIITHLHRAGRSFCFSENTSVKLQSLLKKVSRKNEPKLSYWLNVNFSSPEFMLRIEFQGITFSLLAKRDLQYAWVNTMLPNKLSFLEI